MASAVHIGAKHSQEYDKLKDRRGDGSISAPLLVFTDAEVRDDLYKLDKGSNANPVVKFKAVDRSAAPQLARKKPHLADLVIQSPTMSAARPKDHHANRPKLGNASYSTAGIGVALGSPSQSPWTYGDPPGSSSSFETRGPSPLSTSVPSPNLALDEGLRDRGKWKMFGGLFAKKPTSNPATPGTPFYKAQYPASAHQTQRPQVASSAAHPRHRRVTSRSLDNIHSSTAGKSVSTAWTPVQLPRKSSMQQQKPFAPPITQIRSPTPPPKDYPAKKAPSQFDSKAAPFPTPRSEITDSGTSAIKPETKPSLLEIDIPSVQMERYSIMFSDVLKPRQSLLARRQAQLPQLKVLDPPKVTQAHTLQMSMLTCLGGRRFSWVSSLFSPSSYNTVANLFTLSASALLKRTFHAKPSSPKATSTIRNCTTCLSGRNYLVAAVIPSEARFSCQHNFV